MTDSAAFAEETAQEAKINLPHSVQAIRKALLEIYGLPKLTPRERNEFVAAEVVRWLWRRGKFYQVRDRPEFASGLYFDAQEKVLKNIQSDLFQAWISDVLSINRVDRKFSVLMAAIETESLTERSVKIEPARFWASTKTAIYLSNAPGTMIRITAEGVEMVDNGTDGILFRADATLLPWTLTKDLVDPFVSCSAFSGMNASDSGKWLFTLWALSLPTSQKTKPPLVTTGPPRSGKTRCIAALMELYGLPPRITALKKNGDDDFWATLDGGGMVCFDNADTRIDWLPDAIEAAATNGVQEKRKLWTDSDLILLRARAWVSITSASPSFASSPALADRMLVVRMNARVGQTAESRLSEEIEASRNSALSWIAAVLHESLKVPDPGDTGLNKRHPDFASFAMRIAKAMDQEERTIEALKKAESDKAIFNVENDNIGKALLDLLEKGAWVGTAKELKDALYEIDSGMEKYSANRIAARILKLWEHLEALTKAQRDTGHGGFVTYSFLGLSGDGEKDARKKSMVVEMDFK